MGELCCSILEVGNIDAFFASSSNEVVWLDEPDCPSNGYHPLLSIDGYHPFSSEAPADKGMNANAADMIILTSIRLYLISTV